MQVFLDLFALVLNCGAEVGEHLLIETDHSVAVHMVLSLVPLRGTHLEGGHPICLLRQVALAQCLLRRTIILGFGCKSDVWVQSGAG